jgi:Nucleotidyl transferase AbiEii toxin, Type IV TA system
MNTAYLRVIAASDRERSDLFLAAANRVGTTVQNIEKDFWVCWTLDALFNGLKPNGPRLLFKGGTSLSKAYGLISRFSEDIDVTVFREDIGQPVSVAQLEALSNKQQKKRLDAIKHACQAFIAGPLRDELSGIAARTMTDAGRKPDDLRILPADDDPDRQSLLVVYPSAVERSDYVRPAVKIESGAKSALDPHAARSIMPYLAEDLAPGDDLSVPNVTTVDPERTFLDKIVILHGLRHWFERKGELRGGGQRVSRHYYDIHRMMESPAGKTGLDDRALAADCVRHARMFFYRRELGLETAEPGSFTLSPRDGMIDALRRDYAAMSSMIFGSVPKFDDVLESVRSAEQRLNAPPPV